jgi:hypothetical protein
MEAYAHEKQFVLIYTVCQTVIPALLDSWVKNTPSVKMLYPLKKILLIFSWKHNTLSVQLFLSCEIV